MNASIRFWMMAGLAGTALVVSASFAHASYVSADIRFPAPQYTGTNPVEYATPGGVYRVGTGIDFFDVFTVPPASNLVDLPSTPSMQQINSFFDVFTEFDLTLLPAPPVYTHAPLQMTTSVVKLNGLPPGEPVWSTEMLQLDIAGGTLPPGVMIRESPTKASTGSHSLTSVGGGLYEINSFFDVFTELSIDGGQTWTPGNSAQRLVGVATPEPTAALLLMLGSMAMLGIRRRTRG